MGSLGNTALDSDFPYIPTFPTDVPTAPLKRLSLASLLSSDPSIAKSESLRLFDACTSLGFFYLDLRDTPQGDAILKDSDDLFLMQKSLFALPEQEKQKYNFIAQGKETYFGYKGIGGSIIDKDGRKDRNEFWNVSKDDILSQSNPWPAPPILHNSRPLQEHFIRTSHVLSTLILSRLSTHLALPPSTLPSLHNITSVSGDQIRLLHAPPQPAHDRDTALGAHTDFGSVTILFNKVGGLQVLLPGTEEWHYVCPLPGHAIVNLGDALVKFSNGLLRSNIHRVVNPPGEQGNVERYSLVYFMRPGDDVILKSLGGSEGNSVIQGLVEGVEEEDISSKDWIMRRVKGRAVAGGKADWEKGQGTEGRKV